MAISVGYHEVLAREVRHLLGEGALVVDVRQWEQYRREHVKGALLLPVRKLKERLGELPGERKLLFVCEDGTKSMLACELALAAGFPPQNLYNLLDGLPGCRKAGYPMERLQV